MGVNLAPCWAIFHPHPAARPKLVPMRLFLALGLVAAGVMLIPTAWVMLGVAMIAGGWWVHERSSMRDSDVPQAIVLAMAAIGVAATFYDYLRTLL